MRPVNGGDTVLQQHHVVGERRLVAPGDRAGGEAAHGACVHAPDDLMLFVEPAKVLFAGDLYFNGRLPFVVDGNTRGWLGAIEPYMNWWNTMETIFGARAAPSRPGMPRPPRPPP